MWSNRFEGWYFKHQKDGETVAFIPGHAESGDFIQVITNEESWFFDVPKLESTEKIYAGKCVFGTNGISIDLPDIYGNITYGLLTPIGSDIMGPFRFLPMECRHGVISMGHTLQGSLIVKGREIIFNDGLGYIEKDSGRSFPSEYLWLQSNDFQIPCSIMVSIARIPFAGLHFRGCICAIIYEGREYRFATYNGVKILDATGEHIRLSQGKYLLEINIHEKVKDHPLKSPIRGNMAGLIRECNGVTAQFRLWEKEKLLFDLKSSNTSFESFRS